jgi:16S rRNA (cytosine1402-N4)-methyltransferase
MAQSEHVPVLLSECMQLLDPRPGGAFIDCTVNGGGHSAAILERTAPDGPLLGFDADPAALERARARLAGLGERATFVHSNFRVMGSVAQAHGFSEVDGILMDLGFSSDQLAASERGFSFSRDETLDMRYDASSGESAAEILATAPREEIAQALYRYGEEPHGRRIADAIVAAREHAPLRTSGQLADLVSHTVGGRRGHLHPATRTFQALRILVNDELGSLSEALPQAVALLRRGGRLAVISFHSLEDRIVKTFMRHEAGLSADPGPRGLPILAERPTPRLRILTRHPATATDEEVRLNPRSRSARLRVAERI